ncbi:MAG: phosphoadenylyl-sulfate reductase, partial [Flavobacteriales bacterium]|nr:phosphoadenylyl-sulfate reductase [Flavobacteriales bacterium]
MKEKEIFEHLARFQAEGKSLFVTSSFQTHSIPLLHLLSRFDKQIPIYCIQTGYLFPETLTFRDEVAEMLNMQVIDIRSAVAKIHQRDTEGNLLFTSDPDRCCYLNKVQPMESILSQHDIWINGVRASQNTNRAQMRLMQDAGFGCERFHPLLYWTDKDIYQYRMAHDLPEHPLEQKGYFSIGCE